MAIDGVYGITETEVWSKEAIDIVEPGYIEIQGNRGQLHFICIDGQMKIKKAKDNYTFTWEGTDEGDPISGNGDFTVNGDTLTGRIYINDGDDSSFIAVKYEPPYQLQKMVNRGMVIVKAKEPFRDWVNSLEADSDISLEEINEDCTAYLIKEFEDEGQRDRALKKAYDAIFTEQLYEWCRDEDMWPKKRTLAVFKKWFDLEFHSVVADTVDDYLYAE